MRPIVGVFALLAFGATTVALADPPAAPAAVASTTPSAAAPTAAAAVPDVGTDERSFLSAGYKPKMQGGTKMWCRKEEVQTGSRLSRDKDSCFTAEAIKEQLKNGREITERAQSNQVNKFGN
jgi:hypothetical protein